MLSMVSWRVDVELSVLRNEIPRSIYFFNQQPSERLEVDIFVAQKEVLRQ